MDGANDLKFCKKKLLVLTYITLYKDTEQIFKSLHGPLMCAFVFLHVSWLSFTAHLHNYDLMAKIQEM
jgi:hypothetical protein